MTFLARETWHPVQIYNYLTNEWTCEKQLTYDPAFPATKKYIVEYMKKWCEENPETSVVRFTTFLYQFTLIFNNLGKERQVEYFLNNGALKIKFTEDYQARFFESVNSD